MNKNKICTLKQLKPNNQYRIVVQSRNQDNNIGEPVEYSFSTLAAEISSIDYENLSNTSATIIINDDNTPDTEYLLGRRIPTQTLKLGVFRGTLAGYRASFRIPSRRIRV